MQQMQLNVFKGNKDSSNKTEMAHTTLPVGETALTTKNKQKKI